MVPADYPKKLEANIPADFADLPRLLGRSTVRTQGSCILCYVQPTTQLVYSEEFARQGYVGSRTRDAQPSLASGRAWNMFDDLGLPCRLALLVCGEGGGR